MSAKSPAKDRSAPRRSGGCLSGLSTKRVVSSAASCTASRNPQRGKMNSLIVEAREAMVVVMEERATEQQIELVVARLVELGMDVHRSTGVTRTVLGVVGKTRPEPALIE